MVQAVTGHKAPFIARGSLLTLALRYHASANLALKKALHAIRVYEVKQQCNLSQYMRH